MKSRRKIYKKGKQYKKRKTKRRYRGGGGKGILKKPEKKSKQSPVPTYKEKLTKWMYPVNIPKNKLQFNPITQTRYFNENENFQDLEKELLKENNYDVKNKRTININELDRWTDNEWLQYLFNFHIKRAHKPTISSQVKDIFIYREEPTILSTDEQYIYDFLTIKQNKGKTLPSHMKQVFDALQEIKSKTYRYNLPT